MESTGQHWNFETDSAGEKKPNVHISLVCADCKPTCATLDFQVSHNGLVVFSLSDTCRIKTTLKPVILPPHPLFFETESINTVAENKIPPFGELGPLKRRQRNEFQLHQVFGKNSLRPSKQAALASLQCKIHGCFCRLLFTGW